MATTVILGAGIISTSTAYYLSLTQLGSTIRIVQFSPVLFASASSYTGKFPAKDQFSPPVASLGTLSFEDHKKLAEEFGEREIGQSTGMSYTHRKGRNWWWKEGEG